MWAEVLEGANLELLDQGDEVIDLPRFTHQHKNIIYPITARPLPNYVTENPHLQCFFDGGAASKLGTGGYVIFN
jgi:hypothetical protein